MDDEENKDYEELEESLKYEIQQQRTIVQQSSPTAQSHDHNHIHIDVPDPPTGMGISSRDCEHAITSSEYAKPGFTSPQLHSRVKKPAASPKPTAKHADYINLQRQLQSKKKTAVHEMVQKLQSDGCKSHAENPNKKMESSKQKTKPAAAWKYKQGLTPKTEETKKQSVYYENAVSYNTN